MYRVLYTTPDIHSYASLGRMLRRLPHVVGKEERWLAHRKIMGRVLSRSAENIGATTREVAVKLGARPRKSLVGKKLLDYRLAGANRVQELERMERRINPEAFSRRKQREWALLHPPAPVVESLPRARSSPFSLGMTMSMERVRTPVQPRVSSVPRLDELWVTSYRPLARQINTFFKRG